MTDIDFDARYSVADMPGVAWYLRGYVIEDNEVERYDPDTDEYSYENEPWQNTGLVRAVMVGDDREHIIDVDDLTMIAEEDYCHVCGQLGCQHDGLER